jgi:hypothetical protein
MTTTSMTELLPDLTSLIARERVEVLPKADV